MTAPNEDRIADLVAKLTLEEKISLLAGADAGQTRSVERLGIPPLKVIDGPLGVGWGNKSTCFPAPVTMAATWNTNLVQETGAALGRETREFGRQILLGPCVNIHRTPLGGRNFESFGEDPYLAARMAVSYVKGVQSEGVGTSIKHFACNNQEWQRLTIDAKVDERALREIYLPAFRAAVMEAHPWTVMSAYNMLNGSFCSANRQLLTDVLKKEWKFDGLVVSDWGGCHSTAAAANAGLDLEMPGPGEFFGDDLLRAVRKGDVSEATIDDKVRRILRTIFRAGLMDGAAAPAKTSFVGSEQHRNLARAVAREGIVLLKNESDVLPLNRDALHSIAVIGPNAAVARLGGGGSSTVQAESTVTPLEGLTKKCGSGITVTYAQGCAIAGDLVAFDPEMLRPPHAKPGERGLRGEYFANAELEGNPALVRLDPRIDFDWGAGSPDPAIPADHFSVRWTGELVPVRTGDFEVGTISDDGSRVYVNGELLVDQWYDHQPELKTAVIHLETGKTYQVRVEYYERTGDASVRFGCTATEGQFDQAVALAKSADVAIVFAGLSYDIEAEGKDRTTLALPGCQNQLISAVAKANPKTIVVLNNGTPITMDAWLEHVPAVVEAWYPGQQGGEAIADILFGDVNPSGKLPVTFPVRLEDSNAYGLYPGNHGVVHYAEGIMVGYRFFDLHMIEPLFPFGHGLSYTAFTYSNLQVNPWEYASNKTVHVSFDLENTGARDGAEVVQLYVRDFESSLPRPLKELKAFRKVALKPGEKQTIRIDLGEDAFSYYDPQAHRWVVEQGAYEIIVGSSSRDIRLREKIGIRW